MGLAYKILLSIAVLVLIAVAGVCGWLFVYTKDLPDTEHLSRFAPGVQTLVPDSCLASTSMAVPFDRIGKPLQDALAIAEPHESLPDQIARTLMCNRHERAGRYALNTFRLSGHIRRRFSEQQLFTIYANRAYFGPGATGVEGASRQFFHKDPDTLSTEEAALIAGLLRAPDSFSPYQHPDKALQRRNKVLETMVAQGKLSAGEAARAEAAPLGVGIEIEGLDHEYPSCALVQFSVRNTSQREVYVEVYGEEFKANAWTDVDFPYDLRDPRSLYVKRVIVNPNMMRTGASVDVNYDRCLRPSFVKETKSAFINAIKKKDKEAASPVLQRLRVDVYMLDQGHVKRVQQVWSKTFKRVPEKQPDSSSKHGTF
jgi:hypothetical protein